MPEEDATQPVNDDCFGGIDDSELWLSQNLPVTLKLTSRGQSNEPKNLTAADLKTETPTPLTSNPNPK